MSKPRGSNLSWRERQERDPYVQKARRDGWRSRAVYKLEEIDTRERLLRPDMTCVDLGAAPGSWSQYVTTKLKGRVRIVAIDLLEMDSLPNTDFIQGDFTEDSVLQELRDLLGDEHFHLKKAAGALPSAFAGVNGEGDLSRSHVELDVSSSLQFFDLRVANVCEFESADEFPPTAP